MYLESEDVINLVNQIICSLRWMLNVYGHGNDFSLIGVINWKLINFLKTTYACNHSRRSRTERLFVWSVLTKASFTVRCRYRSRSLHLFFLRDCPAGFGKVSDLVASWFPSLAGEIASKTSSSIKEHGDSGNISCFMILFLLTDGGCSYFSSGLQPGRNCLGE